MELAKCTQPYFELQIQYDRQVRCCCYYTARTEQWDLQSAIDLGHYWNGTAMRTLRAVVTSGRAENTGCANCQFLKYVSTPVFQSPPALLNRAQRENWDRASAHFQNKDLVLESTPVKYYLNFGLACNLRCVMCSQQDDRPVDHRTLPVEPLLALKEHLVVANEIALIGGEPLVMPTARRFIDAVLADPDFANVQLTLYSNGSLLHQFLDRLQALRRVNIVISLDSVGAAYDYIRRGAHWDETSQNILAFRDMAAKKNRPWGINLSGVVMKSSIAHLDEYVDWCVRQDLPVHFVPVSNQHFTRDENVFHYPALLKDIPGWEGIFDRAIARLEAKGWIDAGAHPLTVMKAQLQTAWDGVRAHLPVAQFRLEPAPEIHEPAEDFTPLRARLGRMLGRGAAIPEAELHVANLALAEIVESADSAEYIEQHRSDLPAALAPLLMVHLASAWADEDTGLASALENIHRQLVLPQVAPATA